MSLPRKHAYFYDGEDGDKAEDDADGCNHDDDADEEAKDHVMARKMPQRLSWLTRLTGHLLHSRVFSSCFGVCCNRRLLDLSKRSLNSYEDHSSGLGFLGVSASGVLLLGSRGFSHLLELSGLVYGLRASE